MTPKPRRNFSGVFLARDCGNGMWHLSAMPPQEIDVFLRDAESGAERSFETGPIVDLAIEWRDENVLLNFTSAEKNASFEAASAIVHEPLRRLYESLPMVGIDAGARRFWSRVFRLVRIPGGRYLLKVMARSKKR